MNPESKLKDILERTLPADAHVHVIHKKGKYIAIIQPKDNTPLPSEAELRKHALKAAPDFPLEIIVSSSLPATQRPSAPHTGARPGAVSAEAPKLFRHVANVLMVCSGKGGVGKSSVDAAVALRLTQEGKRVGLIDADIHGPSAPLLFNLSGKPDTNEEGQLLPKCSAEGIQVMSIGFLTPADKGLAWRGPMASKTLTQLLTQTKWDVDVLVIDMPPGTGDVQLSLAAKLSAPKALLVTQPHMLSMADARRALTFCQETGTHVLGALANMAYIEIGGVKATPFGPESQVQAFAESCDIPFLGSLPLLQDARQPHKDLADALPSSLVHILKTSLDA